MGNNNRDRRRNHDSGYGPSHIEPIRPSLMPNFAGASGEVIISVDFGRDFIGLLLASTPYMVQCPACKESACLLFNRDTCRPCIDCHCGNQRRHIRTNYDAIAHVRSVLLRPVNYNIKPGDYLYEVFGEENYVSWGDRYRHSRMGFVRLARHHPEPSALP